MGKPLFRKISCTLLALVLITFIRGGVHGAKKDKSSTKKPTITEAELQSHVMSFADRFAAIMVKSSDEFETREPSRKNRHAVLAMVTYSMWARTSARIQSAAAIVN